MKSDSRGQATLIVNQRDCMLKDIRGGKQTSLTMKKETMWKCWWSELFKTVERLGHIT